jgi:2-methylaconitate cis-trans-isomerase PrpF
MTPKATGRPLALVANPASSAKITTASRIDVNFRCVEIDSGTKAKSITGAIAFTSAGKK